MNSPYGLPCVESCLTCHLRSDSFFCALSRESLAAFNQIKHATLFPEGAVIFLEGQTARGIFMLCQGQAKLSTTARDGKTFILRIAKAGEVLGLHATVTSKPYDLTVETMPANSISWAERTFFGSSKSTATPVCTPPSISAVIIRTHVMSSALWDSRTRFRRGSPSSYWSRQRRDRSPME